MDPLQLLLRWDIGLVFAAVLAEQAGLPVPSVPVLVAAGALAQEGTMRPESILLWAMVACLLADHAWYFAGRWRGRKLLAGLCRVSLSPDTCVRRTDDLIVRYGGSLVVISKFIPGISTVAIPTAASMGMPYGRFLVLDLLGSIAWCVAYVGLGMIFSREVQRLIDALASIGGWSIVIVALALALFIAMKFLRRHRLRRLYRAVRIGPDEVARMLETGAAELLILDARSRAARDADPRQLPGALVIEEPAAIHDLPHESRGKTIVTFCTCPNEASAALLAEQLIRAGYERVRVLTGGEDALAILAP
ncbi:MAG TPA: VTT domain-containing protein [Usitatibacter sp.]|jgi:membrane protein DedA with SNARE-associated domain/rhodanese-related sulfurtransferase|nr:VTT domain-containing protein [Usitatibacter sp.]